MTSKTTLKWVYKNLYLSQEIRNKYLYQFNDYTILGQNFVDTTYMMVVEVRDTSYSSKSSFYIIKENVKNPKMSELKVDIYRDNYIRLNQDGLKEILGEKIFKKLLQNGLFKSKKKRDYNARTSMQRLVACLYANITGFEIHHINKNKSDNRFVNLVPLDGDTNKRIENLPTEEMIQFGETKHNEWVEQINKRKRSTLSENSLLIYDILSHSIGKKVKEVHRLFKDKIKSIKVIGKILNTFFYKENFLKYLKLNNIDIYGS